MIARPGDDSLPGRRDRDGIGKLLYRQSVSRAHRRGLNCRRGRETIEEWPKDVNRPFVRRGTLLVIAGTREGHVVVVEVKRLPGGIEAFGHSDAQRRHVGTNDVKAHRTRATGTAE